MGNESKSKTNTKGIFESPRPNAVLLTTIHLLLPFFPSFSRHSRYKLELGRGRSFRFEQGQAKKNVDKDNGFSAGPLNSIWTLTFRKMRTKTIFYDQFHEHLSNKWWSEVNHFETLAQTQLPMDPGDHVQSTEVVRRHFSLSLPTLSWPAQHWPSGNAERNGDGTLDKTCSFYIE